MAQYGLEHRGRRIVVLDCIDEVSGGIACVVMIDDVAHEAIRGAPFRNLQAAQTAGAAFARALIDAEINGDAVAHRGYFVRASSSEQRDGSWLGSYQVHRNENPVPFRRGTCADFHGNSSVEAEQHAMQVGQQVIDAEIKAGTL